MGTLKEDEEMVKYLFNTHNIKDSKSFLYVEVKRRNFDALAEILGRSSSSCYHHWKCVLLPILLTHDKGLPLDINWEWKTLYMPPSQEAKRKKDQNIIEYYIKLISQS